MIGEDQLPTLARSCISICLPGYQIIQIEDLKPKGEDINKYRVTFSDGLTVIFNTLGFWWHIESSTQLPESMFVGPVAVLSTEHLDVLNYKYPGVKIKEIHLETRFEREIKLTDETKLVLYYEHNDIIASVDITEKKDLWPNKMKEFLNEYYYGKNIDYILHASAGGNEDIEKNEQSD